MNKFLVTGQQKKGGMIRTSIVSERPETTYSSQLNLRVRSTVAATVCRFIFHNVWLLCGRLVNAMIISDILLDVK